MHLKSTSTQLHMRPMSLSLLKCGNIDIILFNTVYLYVQEHTTFAITVNVLGTRTNTEHITFFTALYEHETNHAKAKFYKQDKTTTSAFII